MTHSTAEQDEAILLAAGWEQWTTEVASDNGQTRKVTLNFWKDPIGEARSYINEANQAEYANSSRKYSLKEAVRIERRREQTVIILADRKAEFERRNGRAPAEPQPRQLSAAQAAAEAAATEEAQACPA
jgi:hypothetical protein